MMVVRGTVTPALLLDRQIAKLREHLPGVFDGDAEAIHQARVATRRVRELLPLTREWRRRRDVDELASRFKVLGRAFGRVRDTDVRIDLIRQLESRLPQASPSLVVLRQSLEWQRTAEVRGLIKQVEEDEAPSLLSAASHMSRFRHVPLVHGFAAPWRRLIRRRLAARARDAADRIAHATGVYFPNRLHRARIAIKKWRYAAEVGDATGVFPAGDTLRDLRKAQEILGDLHDRQTLIDDIDSPTVAGPFPVDATQLQYVARALEAEDGELHSRYLARRSRLLELCAQQARAEIQRVAPGTPLLIAAAVSSGALLLRDRLTPPRH
jgi:CHAD domain-containing protein